jgi:hypothetical protein
MKVLLLVSSLVLMISITTVGKDYKGAEYRTFQSFLYGRFEVNMKPANREGVISSFFTYHEISTLADWNEIDIENIGRYDDIMQFNTITSGQTNHERNEPLVFNQYEEFHTYAFEWTPDYIAWFIDDVEVYRQTGEHVQTVNKSQKIMMNIWNPEYSNWVGEWNDYSLPAFSYYDWVSYAAYTPGNGSVGSNNNFTPDWHDDFNFYDASRWGKATHTWQGNMSDFMPENIVFKDGKLILCLTDAVNLGYQDVAKPVLIWGKAFQNGNVELKFSEELDRVSAELISNYTLPGATVISASLSDDLTKVTLTTESYDPTVSANIIILNVTDVWGNAIAAAAKTIISASYPELPLKINLGGGVELDYLADQGWNENLYYGNLDGYDKIWSTNTEISNTEEDIIYLTDREGTKKYFVKVPNQEYDVTLMFAEKFFSEPNMRVFDVNIEGNTIAEKIDIFSLVGKNAAYNITNRVTVDDELLEIILAPQTDKVTISGIIITPVPNSVGKNKSLEKFELLQNYPNPFNPSTKISYKIKNKSNVKLRVYDVLGNEIATLVDKEEEAGNYSVVFDQSMVGRKIVSGVYFYQIQIENYIQTKKMLLLK